MSLENNTQFLQRYYRVHAKIYDLTRWTFLFGRRDILQEVQRLRAPSRILEIGCGTGKNLARLCRLFPQAAITGVDLSEAMLAVARKNLGGQIERVTLRAMVYEQPIHQAEPFDVVLCSYSLSMMNPGFEQALDAARDDLAPGGLFAAVDFHDSPFAVFKAWMRLNHVRLDGHLLPKLTRNFSPEIQAIRPAYSGIWSYLLFVGIRRGEA